MMEMRARDLKLKLAMLVTLGYVSCSIAALLVLKLAIPDFHAQSAAGTRGAWVSTLARRPPHCGVE